MLADLGMPLFAPATGGLLSPLESLLPSYSSNMRVLLEQ